MASCPAADVILCRCENNTLMHTDFSTLYPRSGLYSLGRVLFNVSHLSTSLGRHFWEMFVYNEDLKCERKISRSNYIYYLSFRTVNSTSGLSVAIHRHYNGVTYSVHIWRIQRWVRRFILRQRALAVMMGQHARLGAGSCLADVPADVLREVAML